MMGIVIVFLATFVVLGLILIMVLGGDRGAERNTKGGA